LLLFAITDELREFIESGVAVVAGTASAEGRPHMTFVWGPRVEGIPGHVTFFLEAARGTDVIADVQHNPAIALTLAHPPTYRSVQLKGRVLAISEPTSEDLPWVERHQSDFLSATSLVGDNPAVVMEHWGSNEALRRVEIEVARAFDQTPGPQAGQEQ
jgi:hypothetical protein